MNTERLKDLLNEYTKSSDNAHAWDSSKQTAYDEIQKLCSDISRTWTRRVRAVVKKHKGWSLYNGDSGAHFLIDHSTRPHSGKVVVTAQVYYYAADGHERADFTVRGSVEHQDEMIAVLERALK